MHVGTNTKATAMRAKMFIKVPGALARALNYRLLCDLGSSV